MISSCCIVDGASWDLLKVKIEAYPKLNQVRREMSKEPKALGRAEVRSAASAMISEEPRRPSAGCSDE